MDAAALYVRVNDLFRDAHTPAGAQAVVDLVSTEWPAIEARSPSPADGETCRLAMLAALQADDLSAGAGSGAVWRARALARFVAVGWTEATATIAMGEAFRLLARANDDYKAGRTLDLIAAAPGAREALAALDVYLALPDSGFALGPKSPSRAVLQRMRHEKMGFLHLVERDFDAATRCYEQAAAACRDRRSEIKVGLGAALVDYLRELQSGAGSAAPTQDLTAQAEAAGEGDLAADGAHNQAVMERAGSDLKVYEIL